MNYELRAELKIKGKTVQTSTSLSVSAPASDVALDIVSELDAPAPIDASLVGSIHLDGYVPPGSTLSIYSRPSGKGKFALAVSGIPAEDNVVWSWEKALSGETYDLETRLLDPSGKQISSTTPKTVTAPSSGLYFFVSSTAQPASATVSGISGQININGSILANGNITLGIRPTGTTTFTQVNGNIAALDGVVWSWPEAASGTQYDVQAYIWSGNNAYAQSTILTITAPSANNVLTINTQQLFGSPSQNTINVACSGSQNGLFQATINYNTGANLLNPESFNIAVTSATSGSQVFNTSVSPTSPTQPQSVTTPYVLVPNVTYYAQYAYSQNTYGSAFSALSPSIQFACR